MRAATGTVAPPPFSPIPEPCAAVQRSDAYHADVGRHLSRLRLPHSVMQMAHVSIRYAR
jgi:hypothetical protein